MKIPWANPNINKKDKQAVINVLNSDWYSMGPRVSEFEKKLCLYLDIKYAVGVNSGTSALDVALKSLGITKNDEVIIPALTYISTGAAVLYNHAIPVFVDIDDTLNIDPTQIEKIITKKTKAIITVDFAGNVCNYHELQKIARDHNISLIVDGAQSLGSSYHGQKCCTQGRINTTSFHSAKLITTIEGGMVFTNDQQLYQRAKQIRNQGECTKYNHNLLGNNYRMLDLVAAFGINQIDRIEKTLKIQQKKAAYYKKNLQHVDFPKSLTQTVNSYLFFPILTDTRDALYNYLEKKGIETRIIFPCPINEQPIFKKYDAKTYPVAKKISKRIISIPIYNKLTLDQQDYIIKTINEFLN
jgi:dTDP-4-amino-4,6-dideoxygalactose transaminase